MIHATHCVVWLALYFDLLNVDLSTCLHLHLFLPLSVPSCLQEAANLVKTFDDEVKITGAIVTKMDGDARGGAALSISEVRYDMPALIGGFRRLGRCASTSRLKGPEG